MATVFAVTGSTSGIGKAFTRLCTDRGMLVVGISRRHDDSTRSQYIPLQWDMRERFSTRSDGLLTLLEGLAEAHRLHDVCLVNNAATLGSVGPLLSQSNAAIRETMDVNFFSPRDLTLAITRFCIDRQLPLRVLSVSTGAASVAIAGWSEYCCSKAAFDLWFRGFHLETSRHLKSAVFYPGVVDTPMQGMIRGLDVQQFPDVARFRDLKSSGRLIPPEQVASVMMRILESPTFGEVPAYDVRDFITEGP